MPPEENQPQLTPEQAAQGEIEELKRRAALADQLQLQLDAEKARNTQFEAKYNDDMGRVNAYLQTLGQNMQPQAPVVEEDDETKRLKTIVHESMQAGLTPFVENHFQTQRQIQRQLAESRYGEEWKKWGPEVDQLLNSYPPNVSGGPGAYDAAMQAIKAKHIDEIIAERTQQQTQTTTQEPVRPGSPNPPRNAQSPTRGAAPKEGGQYESLPEGDRKFVEEITGISGADYEKYNKPNYTEDIMGFKGRDRV